MQIIVVSFNHLLIDCVSDEDKKEYLQSIKDEIKEAKKEGRPVVLCERKGLAIQIYQDRETTADYPPVIDEK